MNNTEYYQQLGVSKNATHSEIKKAYIRLSKTFHPDKLKCDSQEANEKFSKISNAYNILSDPEKREIYDKYGAEGLQQIDMMGSGLGNFFPQKEKEPVMNIKLQIALKDVYNGKENMEINIPRKVICKKCDGTGNTSKINEICNGCKGRGKKQKMQLHGNMQFVNEVVCESCQGNGKSNKYPQCKACNKSGIINEKASIKFNIPKGIKQKDPIILKNEGSYNPNSKNENKHVDIAIHVESEDDVIFKRYGDDALYMELEMSLVEMLCGFNKTLTHMDDHKFTVQNTDMVFKYGDIIKIIGLGMPCNYGNGDLYARLISKKEEIILNEGEKKIIYEILTGNNYDEFDITIPEDSCKTNFIKDDYFDKNNEEKIEQEEMQGMPGMQGMQGIHGVQGVEQCVHQ